jgi:hypothetical protein
MTSTVAEDFSTALLIATDKDGSTVYVKLRHGKPVAYSKDGGVTWYAVSGGGSETQGPVGPPGPPGPPGKDGDTPQRGKDYWNAEDVASMHNYIQMYVESYIKNAKF